MSLQVDLRHRVHIQHIDQLSLGLHMFHVSPFVPGISRYFGLGLVAVWKLGFKLFDINGDHFHLFVFGNAIYFKQEHNQIAY